MSRTRKYNPDTLAVMERYFTAIEACIKAKRLKNLKAYCADTGIETNHFYIQRKDRTRGYFEVGWITPLIQHCGISARWMLTGDGVMFGDDLSRVPSGRVD